MRFPIPWMREGNTDELIRANWRWVDTLDQACPILDYHFVVLDTELTGFNPRRDEIVSIGAVKIEGLRIVLGETFFTCLKAKAALPKDSTLVHRITSERLENAPELPEILPEFLEFCGESLIVGHYIELDMAFINRACKKILGGELRTPCIDTMLLAQTYKERAREKPDNDGTPGLTTSLNLNDLAEEFHLPRFTQHDALEDAIQTAYLFLYLAKKMGDTGKRTLKELYRTGIPRNWGF